MRKVTIFSSLIKTINIYFNVFYFFHKLLVGFIDLKKEKSTMVKLFDDYFIINI